MNANRKVNTAKGEMCALKNVLFLLRNISDNYGLNSIRSSSDLIGIVGKTRLLLTCQVEQLNQKNPNESITQHK
jgi:hypothetical protein